MLSVLKVSISIEYFLIYDNFNQVFIYFDNPPTLYGLLVNFFFRRCAGCKTTNNQQPRHNQGHTCFSLAENYANRSQPTNQLTKQPTKRRRRNINTPCRATATQACFFAPAPLNLFYPYPRDRCPEKHVP